MLPIAQHRLCQQRLGEAHGAEGDLAAGRPVEPNLPPVVRPIEVDLLIGDGRPLDPIDGHRMDRGPEAAVAPVDRDPRVGDAVEHEGRRGDPELRAPADAAQSLDDEVDPEQEVAGPVALVRIAHDDIEPSEVAVVPGQALEVRFGVGDGQRPDG
jgi:hypothetical protein